MKASASAADVRGAPGGSVFVAIEAGGRAAHQVPLGLESAVDGVDLDRCPVKHHAHSARRDLAAPFLVPPEHLDLANVLRNKDVFTQRRAVLARSKLAAASLGLGIVFKIDVRRRRGLAHPYVVPRTSARRGASTVRFMVDGPL